jgi:hypothetical protein
MRALVGGRLDCLHIIVLSPRDRHGLAQLMGAERGGESPKGLLVKGDPSSGQVQVPEKGALWGF